MAGNTDGPKGFVCIGHKAGDRMPSPGRYGCASNLTVRVGDLVRLDGNNLIALATATSPAVGVVAQQDGKTKLGTAVESGATSGAAIYVWDDPGCIFEGQTSGSVTTSVSFNGKRCDPEGTTNTFEVNEDATAGKTLCIEKVLISGVHRQRGALNTGSNTLVHFTIARHQRGTGEA